MGHVLLAAVLLFLVAFLAWARWATLDEVTRGDGRVIPSRQIQVVQNLEGGIIAAILVREGEIVDEGQVLMRIDNVRAATDYREKRARYLALLGATARLRAEIDETAPAFPAEVTGRGAGIGRERAGPVPLAPGGAGGRAGHPAPAGGAARPGAERAETRLAQLDRSYRLAERGADADARASAAGVPKGDLLRLQRQVNDLQGELEQGTARRATRRIRAARGRQADREGVLDLPRRGPAGPQRARGRDRRADGGGRSPARTGSGAPRCARRCAARSRR